MNYWLEGILKWPARARHAFGFGLHSPFAFKLVTSTLRDTDSGYYAYDDLGELARRHGRSEREARALYRLLLALRVEGFRPAVADNSPFLAEIAAMAFPGIEVAAPGYDAEAVRAHLEGAPALFLLAGINRSGRARELRRALLADHGGAMLFDGWHTLLAVSRRGLPAQRFATLFPR